MLLPRILAVAALLTACGPEYPKFSGTFRGAEFEVKSAFYAKKLVGEAGPQAVLFFSNIEGLCDKLTVNDAKWPTGGSTLTVRPYTLEGTAEVAPIGPGEYHFKATAPPPEGEGSEFHKYCDAKFSSANPGSCDDIVPASEGNLAGGRVVLTKFDFASGIEGTLDLTFANGDILGADFALELCEFNYDVNAPLACGD